MEISEYIENRVKSQQNWYEKKASKNKRLFMHFQTAVIVLGAAIPVLVVCEQLTTVKGWSSPVSAFISAIIAILAGIDKLRQPQANWFNFRANEEMLKKEQWLHEFKAGPYRNVKHAEVNKLLVERVESIISADIARFAQAEYKEMEETIESEPNVQSPIVPNDKNPPKPDKKKKPA